MYSFNCRRCGGTNLAYQKWVEACMTAQIHDDGHIEYHQAVIDEDNDLGGVGGFVCMDCKDELYFCGCRIQTEEELTSYLSLDQLDREEQNRLYKESIVDEAREEEGRQEEDVDIFVVEEK